MDRACQQLIIDHHRWVSTFDSGKDLPCIFGDILKMLPDDINYTGDFEGKRRRVEASCLVPKQWCETHNRYCDVIKPGMSIDIDISGLPCPDNSKANRSRKYEEGPSAPIYMAWAKRHRLAQTPLILLENVPDAQSQTIGGSGV